MKFFCEFFCRNRNFFERKNFLDTFPKKFGSTYAQSPRKCSNFEILAKIEGKEANFFSRNFTKGI
jgi:hypothetical protein